MKTAKNLNCNYVDVVVCLAVLVLTLTGCVVGPGGLTRPEVASLAERAEDGDPPSQYRLGLRYTNGHGVGQDFSKATEWFERAAASGHADAQYMAGINHNTGRGVAVNFPKAVRLFEMAAAQGHVRSFYQLGDAYANGRGVTKDLPWAVYWYEQAAHKSHAGAMLSFGVLLATGTGVAINKPAAWAWLDRADLKNQSSAIALRDQIGKSMTSSQLTTAKALSERLGVTARLDANVAGGRASVRYVQRMLNRLGFSAGPEDGVMGEKTRAAVRRFQTSRNLATSGEISADDLRTNLLRAP